MQAHFLSAIAEGLSRNSAITPDRWACKYRKMGKPFPGDWSFKYHPWLFEMHRSKARINVGQKAAQMGFSEWALNMTLFNIDIKRINCLYILPTRVPDASEFSASRFNPALEGSEYLAKLFSSVSNTGHKRAGPVSLYIRGSKSRSGLKSIPAGFIVYDEMDEMNQDNIALAAQRQSGQREEDIQDLKISTPTTDGFGINGEFIRSTMEEYFFRCPACSRMTQLVYPDCLEITADSLTDPKIMESHLKCKECKAKLHHEDKPNFLDYTKAEFVAQHPGRPIRGFTVSQLYSYAVTPPTIAQKAIMARSSLPDEQELHNSILGKTVIVGNSRIEYEEIQDCVEPYTENTPFPPNLLITMGVDVGKFLHYVIVGFALGERTTIDTVNFKARARNLIMGKCINFEEIDDLIRKHKIKYTVVDIAPERRKALDLASRFPGRISLCQYTRGNDGRSIKTYSEESYTIAVDRTSWLDCTLSRFKSNSIALPVTTSQEYRDHIHSMVKKYEKDKDGNPVARYVNGVAADHFAHAQNYAEIALRMYYSGSGTTKTLSQVF